MVIYMNDEKKEMMKLYDGMNNAINNQFTQLDVDNARTQITTFLIAQAQNELHRVVKLTQTLDKMQDMYIRKSNEYMLENDDETAIAYLPVMIDTISKCLERSNNIINNVLGNKNIQNNLLVFESGSQTIMLNNNEETRTQIADPVSRAKIRERVTQIINQIDVSNIDNNDDIE